MKIGLIGTGLMGLPMAQRLQEAGLSVMVYNRTADKLADLRHSSVAIAPSPLELVQQCQVVIVMLSDAAAIRSVLLTDEMMPSLAQRTLIQMGTIAPSESRQIHQAIATAQGDYLEAPVLGSIPEVKAGTLQIMVGATPEQFQQWRSLLQPLGTVQHIGPVGTAAALKLALNQLIASLTTAFSLSLGFVQQQGVDVETFMTILRQSALYAPTFDKKLQRMVEHNFEHPNFPTKHLLKDTRLFLSEAETLGQRVDSLVGVREILDIACKLGLADADYSALFAAVNPNPAGDTV